MLPSCLHPVPFPHQHEPLSCLQHTPHPGSSFHSTRGFSGGPHLAVVLVGTLPCRELPRAVQQPSPNLLGSPGTCWGAKGSPRLGHCSDEVPKSQSSSSGAAAAGQGWGRECPGWGEWGTGCYISSSGAVPYPGLGGNKALQAAPPPPAPGSGIAFLSLSLGEAPGTTLPAPRHGGGGALHAPAHPARRKSRLLCLCFCWDCRKGGNVRLD